MSSPLRAQFPQGKKGEGRLLRGRGWNHGGSCGVRWRKSRGLEFDLSSNTGDCPSLAVCDPGGSGSPSLRWLPVYKVGMIIGS